MSYFAIKNWEKFQHYRDRRPPWIKLHVAILEDRAFMALGMEERGLLLHLWVLASKMENLIPYDPVELGFRFRIQNFSIERLTPLFSSGFLVPDSDCKQLLPDCKQALADAPQSVSVSVSSLSLKKEGVRGRKTAEETAARLEDDIAFDAFWRSYPRKEAKIDARKAWDGLEAKEKVLAIEAASRYADFVAGRPQDKIALPATWLRGKRFNDEYGRSSHSAAKPAGTGNTDWKHFQPDVVIGESEEEGADGGHDDQSSPPQ